MPATPVGRYSRDVTHETVLVVGDERITQDRLAEALAGAGYRVLRAEAGFTVLDQCAHGHPAAVVLDVHLPYRSGLSVLKDLKGNRATAPIPVVLLVTPGERLPQAFRSLASATLLRSLEEDRVVEAVRTVAGSAPAYLAEAS